MHDKRSAWTLAGVAPQKGDDTRLSDIIAAAMTELPVTKQWRADQISATRGGGCISSSRNVLDGSTAPLVLQPSQATRFEHGFSWLAKYLPEGRTMTSQIEEALWEELTDYNGTAPCPSSTTSISAREEPFTKCSPDMTALAETSGRDLCPARAGCCARLPSLRCLGGVDSRRGWNHLRTSVGRIPDAPLNTTHPMAWVIYANPAIAAKARPVLQKLLNRFLA